MSQEALKYKYTLELSKQDGSRLGAVSVAVDWTPVLEWAGLMATRKDPTRPLVLQNPRGSVEPVWDGKAGKPYLQGLRAIVPHDGRPPAELEVPLDFFKTFAQLASSTFVENKQLAKGETFQYHVCAYEAPQEPAPEESSSGISFSVEPVAKVLDLDEQPLEDLLGRSTAYGQINEQQMPTFLPKHVLEEAVRSTREAGCVETGGILIGHLHRDSTRPEIFLEVTAQIPAQHVEQNSTRLAFTKETWAAVDAAIALRARGEIYLGWWHSHPAREWCKECPPEKQAQCKLTGEFFSLHDVALHRTVFPRAYSVALVISDSRAEGLGWRLFGWRYGQMGSRGFHIIGAGLPAHAIAGPAQPGDREED